MKKLIITSTKYTGEVEVVYNTEGWLHYISFINCDASLKQRSYLKGFIPADINTLMAKEFAIPQTLMIAEAEYTVNFEDWYNDFNLKRNKMQALALWNKLSQAKKIKCSTRTKAYKQYLKRNTWLSQMYPDTWIRGEHWEDEWEKI